MNALAIALALAFSQPSQASDLSQPWIAGRVYTSPTLHVGVRPAVAVEIVPPPPLATQVWWGAGGTVQVSAFVP